MDKAPLAAGEKRAASVIAKRRSGEVTVVLDQCLRMIWDAVFLGSLGGLRVVVKFLNCR